MEKAGDIIPGLLDDVALECLVRVPPVWLHKRRPVCKLWESVLKSPDFVGLLRQRLLSKCCPLIYEHGSQSGKFMILLQENKTQKKNLNRGIRSDDGGFRLTVYDIVNRKWNTIFLGTLPGDVSLPFLNRVTVTGEKLVLVPYHSIGSALRMGDEPNWVWVYDFSRREWRKGAPMPGPPRYRYACASDGFNTVFVAGGCDPVRDTRLRSAMAYDVERDEWIPMPPSLRPAYCRLGPFVAHKFYLAGEYDQYSHEYDTFAQAFDLTTFSWSFLEREELEKAYNNHREQSSNVVCPPRPPYRDNCDFDLRQSIVATLTHGDHRRFFVETFQDQTRHLARVPPEYRSLFRGYGFVPFIDKRIMSSF